MSTYLLWMKTIPPELVIHTVKTTLQNSHGQEQMKAAVSAVKALQPNIPEAVALQLVQQVLAA